MHIEAAEQAETASTTHTWTAAGAAMVAGAALLFGSSGVATRLLAPGLGAITTAGWRVVIGGTVLVGISAAVGRAPWSYPLRWRVIAPGGLAFFGFQLGYFLAVNMVGVATATIVTIGTGPVVAGLLDRMRRGTVLRVRWWLGVAVAVSGIATMTGGGGQTDVLGWAAAVAAGCCFPVFGDAIRELAGDRPALTAVATVFAAAIVPAAVVLVIAGTDPFASVGTVVTLLYLGLVTTAAAYALWSAGLAMLSLGETVTLTMIEPIAATALAVAILDEPAGVATVVGALVTLTGVWIATGVSAGSGSQRRGGHTLSTARRRQPISSAAQGGFAPAREQVIAETLDAKASAAVRPSRVRVSKRPPR